MAAKHKECKREQGRLCVTVRKREEVKEESRLGGSSVAVFWCVYRAVNSVQTGCTVC